MGGSDAAAGRRWQDHATPHRIIDAAERLLAQRDIHSIVVADILQEAKVARGTFYLWFDNKFDLIGKAYLRASTEIGAAARRWADHTDDGDPRTQLEELFGAAVESWTQHGPVLRAVQDTWRTEAAVAAHWMPSLRWARSIVADQIARTHGRPSPSQTDLIYAGALVNLSENTLYQAASSDDFSLESGVDKVIAAIWYEAIYELERNDH